MDANPSKPAQLAPDHIPQPSRSSHTRPKSRNKPAVTASRPDPALHSEASTPVSDVRDHPHPPPPQPAPPPSSSYNRFTAHLQPYPGPAGPYLMNPPYSMNGNPYPSSPSPFHQPQPAASPANGQNPHIGPGIPGIPGHYSYPVHHPPYPHPYPSYPHYPPSNVIMYSPSPAAHPDPARSVAPASPAPASSSGKRKRKSAVDDERSRASNEDGPDSSADLARAAAQNATAGIAVDSKKRTKTQRACDSCRSRKIRCDVLTEAEPPVCQHCKQYGFECTFFLPITETRFKKKKMEEEAALRASAEKEKEAEQSTSSPQTDSKGGEVKIYGPTSAAHMLHSQATISSRAYESYDMRYHHSWDLSTGGDGLIRVHEPQQGELQLALPKPIDMHIERDVVEKLVNAYFTEIAPMLPVVTREEFVASSPPPPVLLYAICLVAAARREVPQTVFDSIRYAVNSLIKMEDVLSTASIVNMQSLLILTMVGDCHSQFVPNALSALWIRLGSAIRMAQDLGLHRAESVKQDIELRRRLWGICVISDRWISLTYGHPYMIDVQDCDARLPSSGDPNDLYMDELVRLSVLLGRVQKAIYTPAGLTVTTDDALHSLLSDLETWRNNLPEELQFRGPETPMAAGLLFLFYACVNMIFWRVFMRISYTCPSHLKFALTVEKWSALVSLTGQAIDWLDANDRMYDVWLLVAYCATSCALVQYHTWARRRDPDAQGKLKKLRDCVRKWEASLSPDHMSARRKTAEIIALLYEATLGPPQPPEVPALNPTGGVRAKPPLGGLVFQKDPSRPGGGVFVAHGKDRRVDSDVPEGTIIAGSESESEVAGTEQQQQSRQQLQHQLQQQHGADQGPSSMVNFTPLGGNMSNMNPALNNAALLYPGNVQVMNVLDFPQASGTLEQLAMADNGLLEGLPKSYYDWGQWESFFSRIAPQASGFQQRPGGTAPMAPAAAASSPQEGPSNTQYYSPSGGM
ncbi:fungal-specific transcription factor domain-containing protein [Sparassis latifolia]